MKFDDQLIDVYRNLHLQPKAATTLLVFLLDNCILCCNNFIPWFRSLGFEIERFSTKSIMVTITITTTPFCPFNILKA